MLIIGLVTQLIAIPLLSTYITAALLTRITSIVLLYCAALAYNNLYTEAIGSGIGVYGGLFTVTSVTQGMEILLFIIGALILLGWGPILDTGLIESDEVVEPKYIEYPIIIVFTLIGSSFLMCCADIISMYICIELQSFAVYVLAAVYRDRESATSAGLKYFLLGALSSALILFGAALIYSYTGLTNLGDIYNLVSVPSNDNYTQVLIFGIIIITIGFLFKVAAAPFHNWAPDVYDGTPTIVTTWLTIMPKIAIFVFLLQLIQVPSIEAFFNPNTIEHMKNLLLLTSALSLLIGTVVGLAQTRIKRLLAYSTISHVGFLLLALAVNTEDSIEAFLFYLIQYSVTNLNLFLIVLAFGYSLSQYVALSIRTDIEFIDQFRGLFRYNLPLAMSIAFCLFSIAGIPPLIGFFGKYIVLYSSVHAGYIYISLIAILTSVVSAAYYLRVIKVLFFEQSNPVQSQLQGLGWITGSLFGGPSIGSPTQYGIATTYLTQVHSFIIATLTMTIALFMLNPSLILNSTHLMALTLFTS